jgi:dihydrofolate reductase
MEAPGGEPSHPHPGWVSDYMSSEEERYKFQEVLDAGSLLVGRVTYESFAGAWPGYEGEFADRMNSMPKHVVSNTLQDPEWNNTTVLPDLEAVTKLKHGDGGPILAPGSCTLVHGLLGAGLVDELRLMVFPVAVGGGLRVFPEDRQKFPFQLADTLSFPSGVQVNTYFRA